MHEDKRKCWMCIAYYDCPVMGSKGKYCHKLKDYIENETKACPHFGIAKHFYCHKRNASVSVEACISIRQRKRKNDSEQFKEIYSMCYEKCKQGKELEKIGTFISIDLTNYRRRK